MQKKYSFIFTFVLFLLPFFTATLTYYILIYIKYKKKIEIPSCVGKNIIHILPNISNKDINIKMIVSSYDNSKPNGLIIGQYPSAGVRMNTHMVLHLLLNVHNKILLPSLFQLPIEQAKKILDENGFHVYIIPLHSLYPHDTVVAYFYENDSKKCFLYVSDNNISHNIMIPNYCGRTYNDISNKNIYRAIVCYDSNNKVIIENNDHMSRNIIKQSPNRGVICDPSQITLLLWLA